VRLTALPKDGVAVSPLLFRPVPEPLRLLLKASEAALALGVSQRLLQEWTLRGEIVPLRLPGRGKARSLRYDVRDLIAFVDRVKTNQSRRAPVYRCWKRQSRLLGTGSMSTEEKCGSRDKRLTLSEIFALAVPETRRRYLSHLPFRGSW
jgi:hypothetical protein